MAVVNLTPPEVLQAEAVAWIEAHGLPALRPVQNAIAFSEAHGDPFSHNPFRRALLVEAYGPKWYLL